MEELTLILTSILAFCLFFYALAAYIRPCAVLKAIQGAGRVLLVIAHPDDETMFFGPTLLGLCRQRGADVHLLCLSNGDYRQKGRVRKKELYRACTVLGLPEENITLLRYSLSDCILIGRLIEDRIKEVTQVFTLDTPSCGTTPRSGGGRSTSPRSSCRPSSQTKSTL